MKGRVDSKGTSINCNVQERSMDTVLTLMEQLFKMRLIQQIAMPIQKQQKINLVTKFRQKMNHLHSLLKEFQRDGLRDVQTVSTKDRSRSKNGLQSKLQEMQRDQIKKIQILYNQLFYEGSFKHYLKIASVFDLPTNLQPMNIEVWALGCKNDDQLQVDCCCSKKKVPV